MTDEWFNALFGGYAEKTISYRLAVNASKASRDGGRRRADGYAASNSNVVKSNASSEAEKSALERS